MIPRLFYLKKKIKKIIRKEKLCLTRVLNLGFPDGAVNYCADLVRYVIASIATSVVT